MDDRILQGYYLCNFNPFEKSHVQTGVDRKVISQIKSFNKAGLNCTFRYCAYASARIRRGLGSLPCISDGIGWPTASSLGSTDYLYIRRPMFSSKEFVQLLREFRRINPDSIIIVEIPSYPYDSELAGFETYFALKKDMKYRKRWKKYIDYIADLSGESEIFGVPTLSIINGVDLDSMNVRLPSYDKRKPINIIFSAFFGPWHGCDLLLKGLFEYYLNGGRREIILHLAGGGNMINEIQNIISELKLDSHVILYGSLNQEKLDELYNTCTLAVGSLALHRRSTNLRDSSLKTREYLAKGIPFIYAGTVDVFEKDKVDFCLQLPSGEHPIDFNRVIDFHDSLYGFEDEYLLIQRIRRYADTHVSMDAAMESVIKVLQNSKISIEKI